jgi:hypothetical protein
MKTSIYRTGLLTGIIIAALLLSVNSFGQERKLPDGTIVYPDGTRRLPNGTVIHKGGRIGEKGTTVSLPDGSVVLPDGTRRYPNDRRNGGRRNGKWLPPGQAKKIYGGSARDYAPGHQKGKHGHQGKAKGHKHKG